MSVKVRLRSTKHLVKHMRLRFGYQTFQQRVGHRNVDPHCCKNLSRIKTGCNKHVLTFINMIGSDDLSYFPFYHPKLCYRLSCYKCDTEPSCHFIIAQCGRERIGMSVGRTPAGTDYLIRQIRVNRPDLISIDHPDIQSDISCAVCKPCKNLPVLFRLTKPEISILMIFTVYLQFLG